ncbi:putative Fluoroacetate dehalogenase [Rhexocercosporidium sp. MPI-PUGE-AT-0058]|nr:putative Fluoroacetate dehalogenase [Rhexocercosporidium sp. MPI-PUGE-AT-0058]
MNSSSNTECFSASAHDIRYMTSLSLESNISTAATDKIFHYHRGLEHLNGSKPILVLIHGYPQSWRHIIPLLPPNIPLFIPDIPGYGRSSPLTTPYSKLNTGLSILNTLHTLLPPSDSIHRIILAGHDRGAHISQRLTVSKPHPSFEILGTILLDITPSLTRWSSFSSPSTAVGGFHWPFLANVSLATSMINALGGDVWARFCLERWGGNSVSALQRFKENQAWDVYMSHFKRESVVEASCDDYRAGAEEDVTLQQEDQKEGRKMDCPVLKVYSELFLGAKYDMRAVWQEFMGKGTLELVGIGGGSGHFVAEEAPEETAGAMVRFYERVA